MHPEQTLNFVKTISCTGRLRIIGATVQQPATPTHPKSPTLQRDLINRGMLQRKSDGSQNWRPA